MTMLLSDAPLLASCRIGAVLFVALDPTRMKRQPITNHFTIQAGILKGY